MPFAKLIKISTFAAIAALSVVGSSQADGWYVSGHLGGLLPLKLQGESVAATGSFSGNVKIKPGYVALGSLGYSTGQFRFEGEVSYRENNLNRLNVTAITLGGTTLSGALGTFDLGGKIRSVGLMANGFYDFKTDTKFTPFIMGGVGAAINNFDIHRIDGGAADYDQTDTVFAYQLGAGVNYSVTDKTDISLSYRYFATEEMSFNDGAEKVTLEYENHSFLIGLQTSF